MISLKQSGELVYHEIPSTISFTNQQDLMMNLHDRVTMEGNSNNLAGGTKRKRGRDHSPYKPNPGIIIHGAGNKDEHLQRKLVHREIERERRKNMTKLYASLGALLPTEFIKGKRSISDRTHQVVNYITHMHKKIEALSVKRDQLNEVVGTSVTENVMNKVSIRSCNGRTVEIQINSCSTEDRFNLSEVLKALVEEGLHSINYTFTKINKRFLHSIQSEGVSIKVQPSHKIAPAGLIVSLLKIALQSSESLMLRIVSCMFINGLIVLWISHGKHTTTERYLSRTEPEDSRGYSLHLVILLIFDKKHLFFLNTF